MAEGTIAEYVERHAHAPLEEVQQRILVDERVTEWIRNDPDRERRVKREILRAWAERHGGRSTRSGPAPATAEFLCGTCRTPTVWSERSGNVVRAQCYACGTAYPDLLALVRVEPVSPSAFVFGEGAEAVVRVGILLAAWAGLMLFLASGL